MSEKKVTAAAWTPETIRRFWNHQGQKQQVESEYFSYQVGDALLNLLKKSNAFSRNGNILDFGCGPGFLLERFLTTENQCYGFDFSDGTVNRVNAKFSGRSNWRGASTAQELPTSYDSEFFNLVTCIETLEHLLDNMIPTTLSELHRLLKPHGLAFFTTPFNEDLSASSVYCPFCDHEFHKVQHVRSFTPAGIKLSLEQYGFRVVYCQNIDLFELQSNPLNRHNLKKAVSYALNRLLDAVNPIASTVEGYKVPRCSPGANLCVIAEKV